MASYVLVIALTAFLAGAASAVFVMLVVGIRKVDRPRTRPRARGTALDAVTRSTLGAGTWPNGPALGDRQDR
jgi:multisubunit Na+/H+ antiporter MnhB subunit